MSANVPANLEFDPARLDAYLHKSITGLTGRMRLRRAGDPPRARFEQAAPTSGQNDGQSG